MALHWLCIAVCAVCMALFAWLWATTGNAVCAAFVGFYVVMGARVMTDIRRANGR
jgi:hypothetical protein